MNNYLSLNLVNGRLGRVAGGGRPRFTLGEQNEVQLYAIDFPKPSTYPPSSLSDAYAYEIIPRDLSGSSVTLKAGVRGGSPIISTNSLFNLPTNLVLSANTSVFFNVGPMPTPSVGSPVYGVLIESGEFLISTIPVSGSIFSFTVTVTVNGLYSRTVTTETFSLDNKLSDIGALLSRSIEIANGAFNDFNCEVQPWAGGGSLTFELSAAAFARLTSFSIFQTSDYSYSFNYSVPFFSTSSASNPNPTPLTSVSISLSLNNIRASSNPGKYGYLDFSSPNWNSVIGTRVEAPIWMEAVIDGQTISQGNAIICRKMT